MKRKFLSCPRLFSLVCLYVATTLCPIHGTWAQETNDKEESASPKGSPKSPMEDDASVAFTAPVTLTDEEQAKKRETDELFGQLFPSEQIAPTLSEEEIRKRHAKLDLVKKKLMDEFDNIDPIIERLMGLSGIILLHPENFGGVHIIPLIGPPGIGKTSVVQAWAKYMDWNYVFNTIELKADQPNLPVEEITNAGTEPIEDEEDRYEPRKILLFDELNRLKKFEDLSQDQKEERFRFFKSLWSILGNGISSGSYSVSPDQYIDKLEALFGEIEKNEENVEILSESIDDFTENVTSIEGEMKAREAVRDEFIERRKVVENELVPIKEKVAALEIQRSNLNSWNLYTHADLYLNTMIPSLERKLTSDLDFRAWSDKAVTIFKDFDTTKISGWKARFKSFGFAEESYATIQAIDEIGKKVMEFKPINTWNLTPEEKIEWQVLKERVDSVKTTLARQARDEAYKFYEINEEARKKYGEDIAQLQKQEEAINARVAEIQRDVDSAAVVANASRDKFLDAQRELGEKKSQLSESKKLKRDGASKVLSLLSEIREHIPLLLGNQVSHISIKKYNKAFMADPRRFIRQMLANRRRVNNDQISDYSKIIVFFAANPDVVETIQDVFEQLPPNERTPDNYLKITEEQATTNVLTRWFNRLWGMDSFENPGALKSRFGSDEWAKYMKPFSMAQWNLSAQKKVQKYITEMLQNLKIVKVNNISFKLGEGPAKMLTSEGVKPLDGPRGFSKKEKYLFSGFFQGLEHALMKSPPEGESVKIFVDYNNGNGQLEARICPADEEEEDGCPRGKIVYAQKVAMNIENKGQVKAITGDEKEVDYVGNAAAAVVGMIVNQTLPLKVGKTRITNRSEAYRMWEEQGDSSKKYTYHKGMVMLHLAYYAAELAFNADQYASSEFKAKDSRIEPIIREIKDQIKSRKEQYAATHSDPVTFKKLFTRFPEIANDPFFELIYEDKEKEAIALSIEVLVDVLEEQKPLIDSIVQAFQAEARKENPARYLDNKVIKKLVAEKMVFPWRQNFQALRWKILNSTPGRFKVFADPGTVEESAIESTGEVAASSEDTSTPVPVPATAAVTAAVTSDTTGPAWWESIGTYAHSWYNGEGYLHTDVDFLSWRFAEKSKMLKDKSIADKAPLPTASAAVVTTGISAAAVGVGVSVDAVVGAEGSSSSAVASDAGKGPCLPPLATLDKGVTPSGSAGIVSSTASGLWSGLTWTGSGIASAASMTGSALSYLWGSKGGDTVAPEAGAVSTKEAKDAATSAAIAGKPSVAVPGAVPPQHLVPPPPYPRGMPVHNDGDDEDAESAAMMRQALRKQRLFDQARKQAASRQNHGGGHFNFEGGGGNSGYPSSFGMGDFQTFE